MGRNIDRKGYEDTMEGFRFFMDNAADNEPLYYSIWANNMLKFASKESDPEDAIQEFSNILRVYEKNNTGGEMMVKFHSAEPNRSLNNKSHYEGSMVFKLYPADTFSKVDTNVPAANAGGSMSHFLREFLAFQELQQTMQMQGAMGAETSTEPKTIWDRIESILTVPIVEDTIAGIYKKIAGEELPRINESTPNVSMAGDLLVQDLELDNDISDADLERIKLALHSLMSNDKDFVDVLEKLAIMQVKTPNKYNLAKAML